MLQEIQHVDVGDRWNTYEDFKWSAGSMMTGNGYTSKVNRKKFKRFYIFYTAGYHNIYTKYKMTQNK